MVSLSLTRGSVVPLLATLLLLNGLAVSTLYWAQSIASLAQLEFGPSLWIALTPSAALAGYAIGVALLAAVARDLTAANGIGLHALILGVSLSAGAVAPAAPALAIACLAIGMGCSLTQRALACAASAVPSSHRGPAIGCVIASGLTGIVVARAVIPAASAALGWRTMLSLDAALICAAGLAAAIAAQRADRGREDCEPSPLPGVWQLWQREPVLRRAALQQACVFAAFNGGWAVFPRLLAHHGVAGAIPMGVVASFGALAAVLAGLLCQRAGPGSVAVGGLVAVLLAGGGAMWAAAAGPALYSIMTLLDVGTQTALVANHAQAQSRATTAAMRGRIAAIVTTIGFAAGAVGAAVGNALF